MNLELYISFWTNLGQKFFVLSKSWQTRYLEDAYSYFSICFLDFELKIHFRPDLCQKKVSRFTLKQDLSIHANNCVHVKWMTYYVKVYMYSLSCFKVLVEAKLF